MRDGTTERACELVKIDPECRPQSLSRRAVEWLGAYFEDGFDGRSWPDKLRRWIQQRAWPATAQENALSPRPPLVVDRGDRRLTITFLSGRNDTGILLLSELRTAPWPSGALKSLPLTEREQQVFRWICDGKTNPEIAIILGISRRTVDKHIEHVLERLGVENRFQAQRLGWELRMG